MPTLRKGKVLDYKEMKNALEKTLRGILSMNLKSAIQNDPIHRRLETLSGARHTGDLGATGQDLILGELFKSERPSIQAIQAMAAKLTKKAYIRYPAVASIGSLGFNSESKTTYIVPLPKHRIKVKAKRYKLFIYKYANQFELPPSLIFSIIHAESHFNPMARSQKPSFGLMQIDPFLKGKEASKHIYKRQQILSPSMLYNPKRKVELGSAYLHLLLNRHLQDIKSPQARLYCAIAAYHAGIESVLKTLSGRTQINKAVQAINRLSKKEVLNRLLRRMPDMKTREYLNNVLRLQRS